MGFIINERFVNIPAQIAAPSFDSLWWVLYNYHKSEGSMLEMGLGRSLISRLSLTRLSCLTILSGVGAFRLSCHVCQKMWMSSCLYIVATKMWSKECTHINKYSKWSPIFDKICLYKFCFFHKLMLLHLQPYFFLVLKWTRRAVKVKTTTAHTILWLLKNSEWKLQARKDDLRNKWILRYTVMQKRKYLQRWVDDRCKCVGRDKWWYEPMKQLYPQSYPVEINRNNSV